MSKLSNIVALTNGKFFTVCFTKKDGSLRTLNGRLGVTKHLKGGKCTVDKEQYLVVYDVHASGYRAVNVDTIQSVSVDGIMYTYNKA